MRIAVPISCLLLAASLPLIAQETPPNAPPSERAVDAPADETQPGRGGRELRQQMRFEALARRLRETLQLDDQQASQFDEIAAKYRAPRPSADRFTRIRELNEQLQAARDAGDAERIEQLATELRDLRREDGRAKFLDEIDAILRDDQRPALEQARAQLAGDARRDEGASRAERTARRLGDELNLTADQQARFDELVEKYQERFASELSDGADAREQRRKVLEELRAARESGDAEAARRLEDQLGARRDADQAVLNDFLAELEEFLTDDQRAVVESYRDKAALAGGDTANVRTVLRAARRVRLTDEQKEKLREIERAAVGEFRKLPSDDEPARAALAERTKQQILAFLTDEQKPEFERAMSQATRRPRPDRPAPPANEPTEPTEPPEPAPDDEKP